MAQDYFSQNQNSFLIMKQSIFVFLAMMACCLSAFAQQPSPDPDTLKNPVKQIDPEVKQEPADIKYVDEKVRITADELPSVVRDTLRRLEPSSWEKSVVYRDKKSNTYTVEIRESGNEKTYRFDKNGKRLKNLDEETDDNKD
jgi:hypothetical protein